VRWAAASSGAGGREGHEHAKQQCRRQPVQPHRPTPPYAESLRYVR
jgi:hypothetical protein